MQSKTGWALAVAYLAVSAVALWQALTCRDGFFCGILAIPVLVPAGFVYLLALSDHVQSPAIMQWLVLVPTLITNTALYYGLGHWAGRLWHRRRQRADERTGNEP